jgi:membrane-bound serine protease (ClpP class)
MYNDFARAERKRMEFLLNPNVAYVLLVVGFLLALLAIVTPGTGLLEVGALFLLALAGYGVYKLGLNFWALIILVLSVIPFVYAIRKPKREWFLALSILGIVVGSLYLFPSDNWLPVVNPIEAVIMSALVAGFIWFVARKMILLQALRPKHDLGSLIGQTGEAKTEVHESGSVQVAGELWSARSEKPIPAGSFVRVVAREGFTLVVEQDNQINQ